MKKRKIFWSPKSRNNFEDIVEYYKQNTSVEVVRLIKTRLIEAAEKLGEFPIWKPSRMTGLYEKTVSKTPYIIAYRLLNDDEIEIVAIIHGARNWTSESFPE